MRGYGKIKANNSFSQNSNFRKEYPFLDVDFDDTLDPVYSSKTHENNDQKPSIIIKNEGGRNVEGVLRRNYTISSSSPSPSSSSSRTRSSSLAYQKNGKTENLERQSSTKAIQNAVKRAFSTRRSCSGNSSRYCRIYDQPNNVTDFEYNVYDYGNNGRLTHYQGRRRDEEDDDEYEIESNGSMEITSNNGNGNGNGNGKVKVGSKVAKACKRLFSR